MGEELKKGTLSSGKSITVVVSDKSSVSEGQHVIADILGPDGEVLNYNDLTDTELADAWLFLINYLREQHPDGKWTQLLNGPGMTTRPTFHIHGTLPEGSGQQTLRFIFNTSTWLKKLKEAIEAKDWPGVEELAVELASNLK